jgi:hypothetical protein
MQAGLRISAGDMTVELLDTNQLGRHEATNDLYMGTGAGNIFVGGASGLLAFDDIADVDITGITDKEIFQYDAASGHIINRTFAEAFLGSNLAKGTLLIVIDGGGSTITTGIKGTYRVGFAGEIDKVTVEGNTSGSIVVDLWKHSYVLDTPPVDADSITASAPPTLASHQSSEDATLTGWTKAFAAGDVFRWNVDSCAGISSVSISIDYHKT